MAAEWLQGAVGRVAQVEGNMGGANFQAFSLNGGDLMLPDDTKPYPGEGAGLGRLDAVAIDRLRERQEAGRLEGGREGAPARREIVLDREPPGVVGRRVEARLELGGAAIGGHGETARDLERLVGLAGVEAEAHDLSLQRPPCHPLS